MKYGVILFSTTSSVMQAEKILLKAGFVIKLIPTPREFSADCGISIRFEWENYEKIVLLLQKENAGFEAIHPLGVNGV
jgi:hypothetical protein